MNGQEYLTKKVFSVRDVVELTGFCKQTVINIFEKEPGVVILERPEKLHKRRYRSLRIPRAVYERVARRLVVRG